MANLNFYFSELESNNVELYNEIFDKKYSISNNILKELVTNKKYYLKLIKYLHNKKITTITINNKFIKILDIDKITLLNGIINYLNNKNINNIELIKEIRQIYLNLDYKNNIINEDYLVKIDNKYYKFNTSLYYKFLELDENEYLDILKNKKNFNGIKLDIFIYSLVNYFEEKQLFFKYIYKNDIINRYLELKNSKYIDIEAINKYLVTIDKILPKVNVSYDVFNIIKKKYDEDKLKNIIQVYINLCNMFTYDKNSYMDNLGDFSKIHMYISYISKINNINNQIVCFEFTEIFGYFLNSIGIKYEIVGNQKNYGFHHTSLIFRYDKFLIHVEPINFIFENDFTNVKINQKLIGFTCLNKNEETRNEFNNIVNECYKVKSITYDDYLPYNKINNSREINDDLKYYLNKIDLVFKKLDSDKLYSVDKSSFLRILMNILFTKEELNNNISYTIVTNYFDLVYIITINSYNYNTSDNNIYLIYQKNKLSFIDKNELINLFQSRKLYYLTNKEIPGIKINNKIK